MSRVYDRPGEEQAAKCEQDAIELQCASRRDDTAFSRQRVPLQQSNTREFNAVVLGAAGVDKSALVLRFMKGHFVESYDPTIEESYRRHVTVDDETSILEVLDSTGTENFTALNEFYIKAGRGFILVFSLTQQDGLREVQNLREQIYRVKGTTHVPIVIVGTKSDLVEQRQVQREALMQLSAMWEMPIYETSAKMDWHVRDVFEDLVRQMRLRYPVVSRKAGRRRHPRPNDAECPIKCTMM